MTTRSNILIALQTQLKTLSFTVGTTVVSPSVTIGYHSDAIQAGNITIMIEPDNMQSLENKLNKMAVRIVIFYRSSTAAQKIKDMMDIEDKIIMLLTDEQNTASWLPAYYASSQYIYDDTENNMVSIQLYDIIATNS